jgi:molybdopterin molybdotransferase
MMLTVEEARARVLGAVRRGGCGVERVMLDDARGRTLGERLICASDWPSFDNSAMDGVAGRFSDLQQPGVTLRVVGVVAAGYVVERALMPGEVMRVMTGAMIPPGADTVVMREDVVPADEVGDGERVTISRAPKQAGAWVRRRGADMRAGAVLAEVGVRVDPGLIGVLASQGRSQVAVQRRPRVAIVTTGDELVEVDQAVGAGQLVNSTSYALAAMVRDAGGEPWVLPRVPDALDATEAALRLAVRGADLVLTVGGVSVGDRDYVKAAMQRVGVGGGEGLSGEGFWRVAMRPGKPLAFGVVDGVPVLGLPGNPVSSYVTFMLFARPAIWKMGGVSGGEVEEGGVRVQARLEGGAIEALAEREEYARGWLRVNGGGVLAFEPCQGQGSGTLFTVATTNGLGVVGKGLRVEVGEVVEVLLVGALSR